MPDGFQAQPPWKRALIIFAGPLFSLMLAAIAFVLLGVYWGFQDFDHPQNRIAMVQYNTEAARIGLKTGDRIIAIDNIKITQGRQLTDIIHKHPGQTMTLLVKRGNTRFTKTTAPRWFIDYLGRKLVRYGG